MSRPPLRLLPSPPPLSTPSGGGILPTSLAEDRDWRRFTAPVRPAANDDPAPALTAT